MPQRARARDVADRLHSASIRLLRHVRKEDRALGLGPAMASALSVLVFAGPRSLKELAAAEQVSMPTMSRVVAGLERAGLALRETHPTDRRALRISATRSGRVIMRHGRDRRVRALTDLIAPLGDRKIEELGRLAELLESVVGRRATPGPARSP